ncbi:NlpC/P60 family protein [Cupriavidus sp. BIC8F]|uniref:NlpC/P60 family protein n=1 Tax=Cupriavidus sp. BIC8F TaxID=3079014 RepID=UPI002916514C|nr:NlpC/P60 family protein [Cupriavidus sp. BIC8F]
MVSRAEFVAEVRTWLGTPYHHQGRLKGVGVDCGGLLVCAGKALGLTDFDMQGYGRYPDGSLLPLCEAHMQRITLADVAPGAVILFQWQSRPSHLGIVTAVDGDEWLMTHAYIQSRKVVEHRLDDAWRGAIAGFFEFHELER